MTIDDHKPRQNQKNANKCKTILDIAKQSCILVFSGTEFKSTGELTMYAHIYRAPKKTWKLIISRSAEIIAEYVVIEYQVESKTEAKKIAKEYGAKPWNYI